jgi:hypothetical protein
VTALFLDVDLDVWWRRQLQERFHRDKGIVARRQNQCWHLDTRDERQRRRPAIVVDRVGEVPLRRRDQVVEMAQSQAQREAHTRQVGDEPFALAHLGDEAHEEIILVEAVPR